MPQLNIALFQARHAFRSGDEALADLDNAMSRAVDAGASLLVTPELYLSGYGDSDAACALAQDRGSSVLRSAGQLAARHGVGLVLGYPERNSGFHFNSAAVFDRSGRLISNYRKVALPNDFERGCFMPGTGPEVFEFEGVRCSVLICYDVEFPELVRRSAVLGAELLLVPTALRARWRFVSDAVVPARAYENAMYVAYCDFAADGPQPLFSGASTICGPDGRHINKATGPEGVVLAKIDTGEITRRKADFDLMQDLNQLQLEPMPPLRIA